MKIKFLSTALILSLLFVLGPKFSLEARHHGHHHYHHNHYAVQVGPSYPAYSRSYVVDHYPASYVQEYYYYPNGQSVTVYHNPAPVVREVHTHTTSSSVPTALWFLGGLSLGFLLR